MHLTDTETCPAFISHMNASLICLFPSDSLPSVGQRTSHTALHITHNLYVGPSHHSALLWHAMRRHRRERIWESSTYGVRTHSSRIHLLLIHVSCLTEWINGGGATARCCTEHVSGSTRRRGCVCVRTSVCRLRGIT